jgi:integrase
MWEIIYYDNGHTRHVSTGQRDRKAANRVLAGFIIEHEKVKAQRAKRTVRELVEFYMEHHVAERVVAKDRAEFCAVPIRAFFGDLHVGDIDDAHVIEYSARRRSGKLGRTVGDSTIRRELGFLGAVLRYAIKNRKRTGVSHDDMPNIERPEAAPARELVLSDAQLDALLAAAQPKAERRLSRAYRFIALARWTAARKASIETLAWSQVDLDLGLIDFRKEGEKETNKRRVAVPIDEPLMAVLRRAHAERRPDPKTGKLNPWVLDNPGAIRKTFDHAAELAGLPAVTPHTLRHTWATKADRAGVDLRQIAAMLGDTEETVKRVYIHRAAENIRDAFALMKQAAAAEKAGAETGADAGANSPERGGSKDGQRRTMTAAA